MRKNTVFVLYPGSVKPLHYGHIQLVRRYAEHPDVKEVKVLIGPGIRNGINQQTSLDIAQELLAEFDNVTIEAIQYPSPILACYKYIETAEPGIYAMAGVRKGDNYKRVLDFVKEHNTGGKYENKKPKDVDVIELLINTEPIVYHNRTDDKEEQPISASILRKDVLNNDFENFKTNYPFIKQNKIIKIWNILQPLIK